MVADQKSGLLRADFRSVSITQSHAGVAPSGALFYTNAYPDLTVGARLFRAFGALLLIFGKTSRLSLRPGTVPKEMLIVDHVERVDKKRGSYPGSWTSEMKSPDFHRRASAVTFEMAASRS